MLRAISVEVIRNYGNGWLRRSSRSNKMAEPSGGGVTPTAIPETTPPQPYPIMDYSFTLQAFKALQKAWGGLTVRIVELNGKGDNQAYKLNLIIHQIYIAC